MAKKWKVGKIYVYLWPFVFLAVCAAALVAYDYFFV